MLAVQCQSNLRTAGETKVFSIWVLFLSCIAIAGIYGSFSLERPTALLVQTVPAILALPLLITNRGATNTVSSQGKRITQISS